MKIVLWAIKVMRSEYTGCQWPRLLHALWRGRKNTGKWASAYLQDSLFWKQTFADSWAVESVDVDSLARTECRYFMLMTKYSIFCWDWRIMMGLSQTWGMRERTGCAFKQQWLGDRHGRCFTRGGGVWYEGWGGVVVKPPTVSAGQAWREGCVLGVQTLERRVRWGGAPEQDTWLQQECLSQACASLSAGGSGAGPAQSSTRDVFTTAPGSRGSTVRSLLATGIPAAGWEAGLMLPLWGGLLYRSGSLSCFHSLASAWPSAETRRASRNRPFLDPLISFSPHTGVKGSVSLFETLSWWPIFATSQRLRC